MPLNTFATIVQRWLAQSFRTMRFATRRRQDGELEVFVRAPRGSRAVALVVYTWREDLWVRFAPPNMCYPVESRAELALVVRRLLSDRAALVTTYRGEVWRGTTLMTRGQSPALRRGETAQVVSWSGRLDAAVSR